MAAKTWRVGTIGYGDIFNMGKIHLESLRKNEGFTPAAVCDADPARMAAAQGDFPGIEAYTDVAEMLAKARLDLVVIITPHNSHARADPAVPARGRRRGGREADGDHHRRGSEHGRHRQGHRPLPEHLP